MEPEWLGTLSELGLKVEAYRVAVGSRRWKEGRMEERKKERNEGKKRKGEMLTNSGPGWSPNLPQKMKDERLAQHRIGSTVPDKRRKRKDEREK
ncbi:hypothetical protein WR25_13845 [Diploscapter pachys]|uniref:Uncharacterized protein n=1 Tax=Diploscapter pachys TaxID=2018661 RepID=A0A2A2KBP2_9BILA|nr:hypothetical protein WR25_13845 [Diploscapter pachys]